MIKNKDFIDSFFRNKDFPYEALVALKTTLQQGNMTSAAKHLGVSPLLIETYIRKLEKRLGVKLLNPRQNSKTRLTNAGAVMYEHMVKIINEIDMMENRLFGEDAGLTGPLTINTRGGAAHTWLVDAIRDLYEGNPQLFIQIFCSDDMELPKDYDVIIHLEMSNRLDLFHVPLMQLEYGLCASPEYLEKFGIPKTLDDLDNHRLLANRSHTYNMINTQGWVLKLGRPHEQPRHPSLSIDTTAGIISVAKRGFGIIELGLGTPEIISGELVQVLPEYTYKTPPIFFIIPKRLVHSRRINEFLNSLLTYLNRQNRPAGIIPLTDPSFNLSDYADLTDKRLCEVQKGWGVSIDRSFV